MREKAIEEGWLDPKALTVHTTDTSMLNMPDLTSSQIDGLMRTFNLYVEFDESEWPEIEKAEQLTKEGDDVYKEYSTEYRKRLWG